MTDLKILCTDNTKGGETGITNRSQKNTADLACTQCSLDEYDVENEKEKSPSMVPKRVATEDAEKHRTALSDKCRYHNLV